MRVVSLAPSVTETLFALGAGSEVVGVSQYCDYPPAAHLPRVGTFLTPNVEAVIGLRPTLVIGLGLSSDTREMSVLVATGCSVITVNDDSLAEVEAGIGKIGESIGRARSADALLDGMRERIEQIHARVANSPRLRVLMLVGHQPMVAVGARTYLGDLLKLANSDNIAASSGEQWPHLSVEYIIASHPDVVLDGQMGSDAASPSHFWDKLTTIPAVRNHRVYTYPDDPVLHPGPRAAQSLKIIAQMIHPEAFGKSLRADSR